MKGKTTRRWVGLISVITLGFLVSYFAVFACHEKQPQYRFLKEYTPIHVENASGSKYTGKALAYSFEADYDSICTEASRELIPKGYSCGKATMPGQREHIFRKIVFGELSHDESTIIIRENRAFAAESTRGQPNWEDYAPRDGWLYIQVYHRKKKFKIRALGDYCGRKLAAFFF